MAKLTSISEELRKINFKTKGQLENKKRKRLQEIDEAEKLIIRRKREIAGLEVEISAIDAQVPEPTVEKAVN